MLKTKVIFTSLVIGFLAFESCQAFYGPFYRPTMLQPFLQDHLERRFDKVPATIKDARLQRHQVSYATTTQATTKTTTEIQTVKNPKLHKLQLCHFKTFDIFSCRHYYSF